MTKSDRLCIKVALWPVAIYVFGLLAFMAARSLSGVSPFPTGSAVYAPMTALLVTFSAIVAANLLRIRLSHFPK